MDMFEETDLVDLATAARLADVSERFLGRLIDQGTLATSKRGLSRAQVLAYVEQRRANIDGLQEITDADEELGLGY